MSEETTSSATTVGSLEAEAAAGRRARWARRVFTAVRLAAIAAVIALSVLLVPVLPDWFRVLSPEARRDIFEGMFRVVLIAYSALALAGVVGTPLLVFLASRSRRRSGGRTGRGLLRMLAACAACLVALAVLEIGSAAWRGWLHRMPTLPTTFEPSPPGEYRIVALGGSSALGEPYRPWLSVGQIVAWQLGQAVPDRRFECQVLAWLGDSLEKQHVKLAAIRRRPDAVIIYSGHNEFIARFENGREERDPGVDEEPRSWLLRQAYRASLLSPCCRLAYEVISRTRLDAPPLTGHHALIDPPLCSPSEAADILADFRRRLESLVGYCDSIGALPILIIPPANEAGFEPSRSTLPTWATRTDRRWVVDTFTAARAAESTDPDRAEAGYTAILGRFPEFAEAHFRLARLLEARGKTAEAGEHYLAALDHDGLPIRCPAPFREAYREVARRHPRCILIDGRRELAAISPTGLVGDAVIEDAHHPTVAGHTALAGAVLREIQARRIFPSARPIPLPLDPSATARHFGLDAERLAEAHLRTSVHYRRVSGYRYDPAERLEKSRRHLDAAEGTVPRSP
ncbi:MAG: hypothetical protein ACYC61_16175 [Isosphaeraceae bacterium]